MYNSFLDVSICDALGVVGSKVSVVDRVVRQWPMRGSIVRTFLLSNRDIVHMFDRFIVL